MCNVEHYRTSCGSFFWLHSTVLTTQDLEELTKSASDEEENEVLSLDRLSQILYTLKEAKEMVMACDPYMD